MKVKDVMTTDSLKSCSLETKLHNAAKTMKDTNRGALPVVDKDNKVVGIVTDRDVCLALATKKDKIISELSVKDAIPKLKVYTVNAEDTVTKALEEMRKNKVGRLPVTDKEGKLKGIISINNLLSHAMEKKEELGQIISKEENLAKTIKSLFDRNNEKISKKEVKEFEFNET
jgi:CBS domain-containing protein